jgi:hypothetical protein
MVLERGSNVQIITLDLLKKALKNSLGKKGMPLAETDRLAEYIINFFGYNDFVIDNKLDTRDRDVFYMLEEEGILKTQRDEVTIQKGKIWRIHYWILNTRKIMELCEDKKVVKKKDEFHIYDELSEDIWDRKH